MRIQSSLRGHLADDPRRYRAVLLDIDGTLLAAGRAIANAAKLVARLRLSRIPFVLLTNDGNHSPEEKAEALRRAGVPVRPREIVSCAEAIKDYVRERRIRGARVFVMGDLGVPCHARRAGLRSTRRTADLDRCSGIIVGEAHYDWESVINGVINSLMRNPRRFMLVPNPDSYWPSDRPGEIAIGAGGVARLIQGILREHGARFEPVYLGKPNPAIYLRALNHLREYHSIHGPIEPARILAVGDNLRSDILGANRMGFTSALVLTGITAARHLGKHGVGRDLRPNLVFREL